MKSNINTIAPAICSKYNIEREQFDQIVEIYFKEAKKGIGVYEKPEIAFLWGTLVLTKKRIEKEIAKINVYLRNRDTPLNKVSDKKLERLETEKQQLLKLLDQVQELKKGKTERGKQGKLNKLNNEIKSDNT